MRYYLGLDLNRLTDEYEIQSILASDEFVSMPCYPEEGALQFIGDVLVVKFKD